MVEKEPAKVAKKAAAKRVAGETAKPRKRAPKSQSRNLRAGRKADPGRPPATDPPRARRDPPGSGGLFCGGGDQPPPPPPRLGGGGRRGGDPPPRESHPERAPP